MKIKDFNEFGVLLGCAANAVPKVETLKKYIDALSFMGYNSLYLETADTYKIPEEPYFGYMRGGYTKQEITELDSYASERGVELVPCIQTLSHLHFMQYYSCYSDIIDVNDTLLVDEEKTYKLIDNMFKAIASMYKTRRINIGMDEAYLLGSGKFLFKHGYENKIEILLRHLERVVEIAEKYGFKCEMWSDVFFHALSKGNVYDVKENSVPKDWKERIPKGLTLVYWEYFVAEEKQVEDMIDMHRKISDNVKYAGTFFKWQGVAPNNVFTNKVMKKALSACKKKNVKNVIFAGWADYGGGASLFAMLPAMWYLSEFAKNGCKEENIHLENFEKIFGIDYKTFTLLDTLNRPYTNFETKEVSDHRLNNKSFFYMYNDIMYGTFDSLISDGIGKAYEKVSEELGQIKAGKLDYIFKTLSALASFLAIKTEIGKNMYTAYKKGDKERLNKILKEDFPPLIERLDLFFNLFKNQWQRENKAFGFENQCIRIGGLKERIKYAENTLSDYLNGKIDKIEEFEEEHLPFKFADGVGEDNYSANRYTYIVSHGFI